MFVLALDPGGTTGWAVWEDGHFRCGEVGDGLFGVMPLVIMRDIDEIVMESFVISANTAKLSQSHDALHIIGAVKWHAFKNRIPVFMQKPSDRKFATSAKFKALGWNPVGDHATSASQHLLLHLYRERIITAEQLVI